jgi:Tol biopolymer transport system component
MPGILKFIFNKHCIYIITIVVLSVNISCRQKLPQYTESNKNVVLSPDYTSISIPPNIAPLNFRINETANSYLVRIYNANGTDFIIRSKTGNIQIPERKWKKLLSDATTKEYSIEVFIRKSKKWSKFNTITNFITSDKIDNYLAYRLIEPGFVGWNRMGIYQRDLETFHETPIMLNSLADGSCINCHTFNGNSNKTMMFHIRGKKGGTIIYRNDTLAKINTNTDNTISQGVYSSWHPSGNYIASSVNKIVQSFHAIPGKKIEVCDTLSDIVVFDINTNIATSCRMLSNPDLLETFPNWSPDGRYLYFCCAKKQSVNNYNKIWYDLLRITFNPDDCSFGEVDTVLSLSDQERSISFPKISPDGKYLLFCISDYGNFSIWHSESDLCLLDLTTGEIINPDINSDKSESFHSWSSTGRWIVFSSRRGDGLYTRPYFSYFDSSGQAHKPFILPQRRSLFYFKFMKSYNIPEFITGNLEFNPGELRKTINSEPVQFVFKNSE